jgi:hypothetical protein
LITVQKSSKKILTIIQVSANIALELV